MVRTRLKKTQCRCLQLTSQPILPNSSFAVRSYGVHRQSLQREADMPAEALAVIRGRTAAAYQQALEVLGGS